MCRCGHREGSHNDLARCCAGECSCGNGDRYTHDYGGFDPIEDSPWQSTPDNTESPEKVWPDGSVGNRVGVPEGVEDASPDTGTDNTDCSGSA